MVKIVGAMMIAISCGYFGFHISGTLKTRMTSLADIITSLEMLEGEINFSINCLKKAFHQADKNGLFKAASESIDTVGIKKAWETALGEHSDKLCLNAADREILSMIGKNLGKMDTDNEIKHIKYIRTLVEGQYKQSSDDYNRLGKLYRNGGVLTGVMIVIMLI